MNDLSRFERNIDRMVSSAVSGDVIWLEQRACLLAKISKLIVAEENRNAQKTAPMNLCDLVIVVQNTSRTRKMPLTLSPRDGEMRIKFHKDTSQETIDFVVRAAEAFMITRGSDVLSVSLRGDVYITPTNTVRFKARTENHNVKTEFEYMGERKDLPI